MQASRLLVIIPDRLSDLMCKGEIIDRYYNPGDLFREVHILMTNDDTPDPVALQRTVGSARLRLHNLPVDKRLFVQTLGWRPWLLKRWARSAVELARVVRPALVRCYGAFLNAFAASEIKAALGIPYLVSLHTNPDKDIRGMAKTRREWVFGQGLKAVEKVGLGNADLVLPVYRDIVPFLQRLGITNYKICYNLLDGKSLRKKTDYELHHPIRILSVGRQCVGKNPEMLVRAVAGIPDVVLTLIGDGNCHEYLVLIAKEAGVSDRVRFIRSLTNDRLCATLSDHDIFAVHNDYWGIPKAVMEPMLVGLPIVVNCRKPLPVSELTDDNCILVENTPEGYRTALQQLISDSVLRAKMGIRARAQAEGLWNPSMTEAIFSEIYRQYLVA